MNIQRYNPGLHHGVATMLPYNNGPYVTYDDHEATVRIKMAEAERNGRQACRLELEWRCRMWGMTDAEMAKHETFGKLLDAYTMHVHQVTCRIPNLAVAKLRDRLADREADIKQMTSSPLPYRMLAQLENEIAFLKDILETEGV